MKQRTIYLLIFICCMSLFTAANGNAKNCNAVSSCKENIEKLDGKAEATAPEEMKFNFSPMDLFVLSI